MTYNKKKIIIGEKYVHKLKSIKMFVNSDRDKDNN